MGPDDSTYTIEFLKDIDIHLLNDDDYFYDAITWNYFNKEARQGVFYTAEKITTLHQKMADALEISPDDILISPHVDGLTNLYYGTI